MCTDGMEHVPPAIENVLALRECYVNCVYLCMIAIHHKNRWQYVRALQLNEIQKKFNHCLHAIG
jgi:hypothetical protein